MQKMCLECQALLLEVDLVVLSRKQILVWKDVAVPHVLYGLLAFQLLLSMFVDISYFCLLVVIADHCAVLQPQPRLGLELGLEWLEWLEQLEWLGPLKWLVEQEEHLGGAGQGAQQALELWDSLVILEHLPEPCWIFHWPGIWWMLAIIIIIIMVVFWLAEVLWK